VLRWLSHTATPEGYSNAFEAFPIATPFRPPQITAKPVMAGSQTAMVVGKAGEEIWTDKYGRVKVQFPWDQQGKRDENSSCWIRVAQGWAGKGWGSQFLPRIGHEVIVSFLHGDPDHPIITGAVYNGQQTVPYPLPGEQTKSTIKSNSSKGGGGFNEIRFEDKKSQEEIFVQAQKDMNITIKEKRTTTLQKGNDTLTLQDGDTTLVVEKGNRDIQVKNGNESHSVKGLRELTIDEKETHTNNADFTHQVSGSFHLQVDGNLTLDVKGSITIQAGQSITIKSGTSLTQQAGTSLTAKAGLDLTHQAGTTLTSKASATQTVDGGGLLTLKGGLVKIN
jgi:type VI secretion system secreted protein VgrG